MGNYELIAWLIDDGGPSIKYRTLVELAADEGSATVRKAGQALMESSLVHNWLEYLTPDTGFTGIHNGKPEAFENVVGKLACLGLCRGCAELDRRVKPFVSWLSDQVQSPADPLHPPFGLFLKTIVASGLHQVGYGDDEAVASVLNNRLDVLSEFAVGADYSIYADKSEYRGIPAGFRARSLVRPDLISHSHSSLPWIHDVFALARTYREETEVVTRKQIEHVVGYTLDPRYQKLPEGYGIVKAGRRYYVMGWDVKLPGFLDHSYTAQSASRLVQRMELMAYFPVVVSHTWFKTCLNHLETFRRDDGTYLFPRQYLREDATGYWVTGAYMGLEEQRRSRKALTLESTFRMLCVKQIAGLPD